MPGVAIRPSAGIRAVWESMTSSTSSTTSGLPARPTPAILPSLIPMLVLRTPSTGSMTTTLLISMSRRLSRAAGRQHAVAHGFPAAAETRRRRRCRRLGLPPPGRCRAEAHPVARRRAVQGGVLLAPDLKHRPAPACRALDQSPEPVGDPAAGQRDQADPAALPAGPTRPRSPRGYPAAGPGPRTVEPQRRVGLEEVIMRRNKHRLLAGVGDLPLGRGAARVDRDRPLRRDDRGRGRGQLRRRGPAEWGSSMAAGARCRSGTGPLPPGAGQPPPPRPSPHRARAPTGHARSPPPGSRHPTPPRAPHRR